MKKILIFIVILILLLPLNQSTPSGSDISIPSQDDVKAFVFALQEKVKNARFEKRTNILEDLVVYTGNDAYLTNDSDPLRDAVMELYSSLNISYEESKVDIFLNKINLSADAKYAIALLMFSYANVFNAMSRQEKLEGMASVVANVKRAAYVLSDAFINGSIYDEYHVICLGDGERQVFDGGYSFIIDFGGNDIYAERNDSFILDMGGNDSYINQSSVKNANLLFDMEGDDIYRNTPYSYGEISLLYDVEGDDKYLGHSCVALNNSISVLFEKDGNDLYQGDNQTQCYSEDSMSILLDVRGDDIYTANSYSQAAVMGGLAILADLYGNDAFFASDYSQAFVTGLVGAGVSILFNMDGNDDYKAGNYSQGYAENSGMALLLDILGQDSYEGGRYSQAVSWFGIAAIMDAEGKNVFRSGAHSRGYKFMGEVFFLNNFNFDRGYEILDLIDSLNLNLGKILLYFFQ